MILVNELLQRMRLTCALPGTNSGTNYTTGVTWLMLGAWLSRGLNKSFSVGNTLRYEISLSSYEITLSTTVRNILLRYEIALSIL